MKKNYFNYLLLVFVFMIGIMVSCTKEGPAGPAGANGTNGTNGTDGTDGVDGNVSCLQCHTMAIMDDLHAQYDLSAHGEGGAVGYAGGRYNCAMCHSDEGYVETQLTGRDTTAAAIPIPTKISCKTCHNDHVTFDFEVDGYVVPLRGIDAVELLAWRVSGETKTLDFGGNSNICANCHQPRVLGPVADSAGNFRVTSSHYGPHYGTQSTVLEGIGHYELGSGYPTPGSDPHRTSASCTSCHMADFASDQGGHSWWPSLDACKTCHPDATSFDVNGKQTEINGLFEELRTALVAKGLLSATFSPVPGVYPVDEAGALYNYRIIYGDHSKGVHNYDYVKTVLINSINAVK
ncbi:MAG: cytochrome c3 family protein [Bacteroidetes bacterium]|nr:cytochrome c3 family protein [Bacteroidota bacterium]MBL6944456.1 cytochrome c3 family protein [Bacteroidales bacterium]